MNATKCATVSTRFGGDALPVADADTLQRKTRATTKKTADVVTQAVS